MTWLHLADTPTSPILSQQRPPSTIVTMYVCVLCKMHAISFPQLCIGSVMNMLKRDLGMGDLCDNIGLVGVSAK